MATAYKPTILIVDDDADTREAIQISLEPDYHILQAENGEDGFNLATTHRPELVIMDVNMPGRDGLWACQQMRTSERTQFIPILILSSRREIEQKLEAYDMGADDYLEKPFTMRELQAKVAAKMRRIAERETREIQCGNLRLNPKKIEAEVDNEKIMLSVLESRLLAYFLDHPEVVLPRREILNQVWADVNVSDRTVDAHIVALRRKIAKFNHEIATVYGAGYALRPKM